MRNITASFRKAAESQFGPDANLCFLTLTHPLVVDAIRVVWDGANFTYGGKAFTGFEFDITLLSDDENPPKASLGIQNADQAIVEVVRSLATPPRIKIELLSSVDFDLSVTPRVPIGTPTVIYSVAHLFLINVGGDVLELTGDLMGWDYLQRVWPGPRALQRDFPGLFR